MPRRNTQKIKKPYFIESADLEPTLDSSDDSDDETSDYVEEVPAKGYKINNQKPNPKSTPGREPITTN